MDKSADKNRGFVPNQPNVDATSTNQQSSTAGHRAEKALNPMDRNNSYGNSGADFNGGRHQSVRQVVVDHRENDKSVSYYIKAYKYLFIN